MRSASAILRQARPPFAKQNIYWNNPKLENAGAIAFPCRELDKDNRADRHLREAHDPNLPDETPAMTHHARANRRVLEAADVDAGSTFTVVLDVRSLPGWSNAPDKVAARVAALFALVDRFVEEQRPRTGPGPTPLTYDQLRPFAAAQREACASCAPGARARRRSAQRRPKAAAGSDSECRVRGWLVPHRQGGGGR